MITLDFFGYRVTIRKRPKATIYQRDTRGYYRQCQKAKKLTNDSLRKELKV